MEYNEKTIELARDILTSTHDAILEDITRECEYLVKRHTGAGNDVLALITWEAFQVAAEACGVPSRTIERAFDRAFPTLSLYV